MFTYAVARDPSVAGFAMVSERFLAVLSADADEATALRLWRALSLPPVGAGHADRANAGDAADLGSVLTAMVDETTASGHPFSTVADFAVVELVDVATRAVALAVRGGAQIVLAGGDVRTSEGSATWRESSAQQVVGLTLQLGGAPLSLGELPRLPLGRGIVRADRLDWGDGAEAAPPKTKPVPAAVATRAAESAEAPLGTLRRERVADLLDDHTELSRFHRRGPSRPVLRMGSNGVVDLDLPIVFGRSPRAAAHPGARLIALPSPRREISSSHLEVHLDGDTLVARDLGSTNGTILREPDGSSRLLRHGATARLTPGASLDLGDGAIAVFDLDDVGGPGRPGR